MPHFKHELIVSDFNKYIGQSQRLVFAARQWAGASTVPKFTTFHRDILIELAFLRAFLAWERFLEESFILFLLGKRPRRMRRSPRPFVRPKSWQHAFDLLSPEKGRGYVDWDNLDYVRVRAKRFFPEGEPFETALIPRLNLLHEMRTVRNAIAHRSFTSQEKFEKLARAKLGYLPSRLTVGFFLESAIPGTHPVQSYLDYYLAGVSSAASTLVP